MIIIVHILVYKKIQACGSRHFPILPNKYRKLRHGLKNLSQPGGRRAGGRSLGLAQVDEKNPITFNDWINLIPHYSFINSDEQDQWGDSVPAEDSSADEVIMEYKFVNQIGKWPNLEWKDSDGNKISAKYNDAKFVIDGFIMKFKKLNIHINNN